MLVKVSHPPPLGLEGIMPGLTKVSKAPAKMPWVRASTDTRWYNLRVAWLFGEGNFTLALEIFILDTDGDGLSDYEENYIYKTDPFEVDTDGDNLNDKKEVDLGTDPTKADTDEDGLKDGKQRGGSAINGKKR